ncbi:MAG: glycosyltransferase family 87 protein, partial [Bacteroidetes bacterium]|nr:glycosyltransferase family 87 protein [Bacteroidota bacterium]
MLKDKNLISCLAFALLGIVLSIVFFSSPIHDFGNYYFGSKFALQGVNIRDIYEPYKFNLLIRNLPGFQDLKFLYNYAVVPPFTLLCYLPFTVTDVYTSKLLFNIISVLGFSFSLFRLLRHLKIVSPLVLLLPLLLFIPFRNNILFGQTYLLLTAFLMTGFVAEEKNKNTMAAIFYALTIALKISPAILLLYMLARKNYKAFSVTILFSSIFFLSSVYFTGWEFMKQYFLEFIPRMSTNEINNPWATTYQSITVLLRNLFIHDQLLNPTAMFSSAHNDYRFTYSILCGLSTG